ncbi:AAA family ATPase [Bradyrhizobium sp. Leo121]|uniref:ATP-binding protein n=1 Tax=Bradyrhizobium sp. Leo121 TaxID=1571195 RepID=UPI0010297BAE|nr:AAA family ATPase [Bradyrhizobium sp. Leo121]RZN30490.1 hypothetical protein CWO90_20350 [Bradyrhizobium sp. Leo121]
MNALPNVTSFAAFAKETSAMVSPPPFGAMWFSQAVKDLPPQKWLIDRIMPEDALVILHGPHGVAKTFVSLDMDIRIAIGEDWRGHRVSKGGVVYVAAEGRAGLRKRLKAWSDHYGDPGNIPFVLMTERVNLLDEDEVKHFIETIKRVNARMEMMGTPLRKITFDTLARCMPRGNENSHEHMGALVDNVDRIRRSVGSVTAMFCHHSGKDQTRGRAAIPACLRRPTP